MSRRRGGLAAGRTGLAAAGLTLLAVALGVPAAAPAAAHPLGNLSVNTAVDLRVQPDAVDVQVLLDLAEIPTLQDLPGARPGRPPAGAAAYLDRTCAAATSAISLSVADRAVPLRVVGQDLDLVEGAAGLATTRVQCRLHGVPAAPTPGATVELDSTLAAGRAGWREITASGDGVRLAASDVPARSPSRLLTDYPDDLLDSPPTVVSATVRVGASAGPGTAPPAGSDPALGAAGLGVPDGDGASGGARGLGGLAAAYTGLVATVDLTLGVGLLAVLLAVVLGALHAAGPGHGKTLMAAHLVGRGGGWADAVAIGLSVTVTHTAGVLALAVVLTAVGLGAPARVYGAMGLVSGLLLVVIGAVLVRHAVRGPAAGPSHPHPHPHRHDHRHHEHPHPHPHPHEHPHPHPPALSRRRLLGLGLAGGLVPSPSALLVLLGGIAVQRTWFGLLLVLAYGTGMAASLVLAGLLVARARGRLLRLSTTGGGRPARVAGTVAAGLPALTAGAVVVLGGLLVARSVSAVL